MTELPNRLLLSRREFLYLVVLEFVFALLGCNIPSWLIPKESEPIQTDFMWLGSSTIKNLGDWLTGRPDFPKGEQTWFIENTQSHQTMFIHGKYSDEGAKINDVVNWLNNPIMKRYVPQHINIFIGSNEITDYSDLDSDEKLEAEAARIIEVIQAANLNFPGKRVHIILPFPTLIDQRNPNTEERFLYERRRNIFNNAMIQAITINTNKGVINNADYITVDEIVMGQDSTNPSNYILDPSAFRQDGRHLIGERLERFQSVVYSKIGK